MKKITKIISIFIYSFLLLSCGFKITNNDKPQVYFQNINIIGEKRIAYELKNDILLLSNKDAKDKFNIDLEIKKKKTNKIKNKSGKTTRYSLSILAKLKITNIENQKIISKDIIEKGEYYVADNYSDTIKNEKNASKLIMQQLSDQLVDFIIISIKN